MGDSGSMLLGLVLAAATVSLTGQLDPNALPADDFAPGLLPLLLPLAVFAVPFGDLVLAVVRRSRAGQAPWEPDKQHLHHRLLTLGHSHARAVLMMYMWSALIAGGTVTDRAVARPAAAGPVGRADRRRAADRREQRAPAARGAPGPAVVTYGAHG